MWGSRCVLQRESGTRQWTPESGHRAGYDGYKRRNGSKIHLAVDTLGEVMALLVTTANTGLTEETSSAPGCASRAGSSCSSSPS